jgi:hypothetical protein
VLLSPSRKLDLQYRHPRPCRSHITLDNPRERYDRPVGLYSSPVLAGAEWDELGTVKAR